MLLPEGDLLHDVYTRGSAASAAVALTFDDGPNGRCTEAVLDALAETHAPATFFLLGANAADARNDGLLARMTREGHALGIHSWDHAVRPLFGHGAIVDDLRAARFAVHAALDRAGVAAPPARFYRPPFGFLTETAAQAAEAEGFAIVAWTVSVGDWRPGRQPQEIVDAILARTGPGDVIVLHDGAEAHQRSTERCVDRPNAAAVVRLLVPALAARGLHPVPLAELLGLPAPAVELTGRAPGH